MGFTKHFYIIFGTNLLTECPVQIAVFFAYFSVSHKRNTKRNPNRMKPLGQLFWEQTQSRGLVVDLKIEARRPRGREARLPPWARPPPSWGPRGSTDLLLPPIYTYVRETIEGHHETLFPPPQPSVPKRSHLGAFSGAPTEGESITEGY